MSNYNWDDVKVGRYDLNHSEKFFAVKHDKHNKSYKESVIRDVDNKENETDSNCIKNLINWSSDRAETGPSLSDAFNVIRLSTQRSHPTENVKKKSTAIKPFSVLKYQEIYESKRQKLIEKTIEEEKSSRIFRSRPAPTFQEPIIKKTLHVTVASTPKVLKRSVESRDKRLKQMDEMDKAVSDKKIIRDARAVHEPPFLPCIVSKFIEPKPFNLHVEKRLIERKQFDIQINKKFEEKRKKEDEERTNREAELIKEQRKCANFKARPNPFK